MDSVTRAADAARVLRFGSGGGFAGTSTTYSLSPTGQFERRSGRAADTAQPVTPLASPSAGQVARCFQLLDSLPPDSLSLKQPGNIYYFVEGQTAGGQPVSITWGAPGVQAPHAARVLYQELMALVTP
jgi:hypothetical protein